MAQDDNPPKDGIRGIDPWRDLVKDLDELAARRATDRAAGRRPAQRGDEEVEDERPSRRKTKSRKKARRGGWGLKLGLILGGVLLGVVVLGTGGYFLVSYLTTSPAQARARVLDEATAALAGVTDQASADAAKPRLLRTAQRLREFHEKDMAALKKGLKKLEEDPDAIRRAVEEAMKNPEKAKAQTEKAQKEQLPLLEAQQRLMKEVMRVQKVPGGNELLASFYEAWGPGSDFVRLAATLSDFQPPGFGGNQPGGKKGR
jgi:hypothetical protein